MPDRDDRRAYGSPSWQWIERELMAIREFLEVEEKGDYFSPSAEGVALFRGLLPGNGNGDLSAAEKEELCVAIGETVKQLSGPAEPPRLH